MKGTSSCEDLKKRMTRTATGGYEFEGPTIVYCPTKKAAENVQNALKCMYEF